MSKEDTESDRLYVYLAPGVLKFLKIEAAEKDVTLSDLVMGILRTKYANHKREFPDYPSEAPSAK